MFRWHLDTIQPLRKRFDLLRRVWQCLMYRHLVVLIRLISIGLHLGLFHCDIQILATSPIWNIKCPENVVNITKRYFPKMFRSPPFRCRTMQAINALSFISPWQISKNLNPNYYRVCFLKFEYQVFFSRNCTGKFFSEIFDHLSSNEQTFQQQENAKTDKKIIYFFD